MAMLDKMSNGFSHPLRRRGAPGSARRSSASACAPAGPEQVVRQLSGGNQQKVVLAKWLETKPRVLIMDEPTRGIDVGAKAEIHALMGVLAQQGVAILMISSELPEVLGMSDRILVISGGEIAAELDRAEATPDAVGRGDDQRGAAEGSLMSEAGQPAPRQSASRSALTRLTDGYGQELVILAALDRPVRRRRALQSALPGQQQSQHHLRRQRLYRRRGHRHGAGHHVRPYRRVGRLADRRARHRRRHAGGEGLSDLDRLDGAGPPRRRWSTPSSASSSPMPTSRRSSSRSACSRSSRAA